MKILTATLLILGFTFLSWGSEIEYKYGTYGRMYFVKDGDTKNPMMLDYITPEGMKSLKEGGYRNATGKEISDFWHRVNEHGNGECDCL